MIYDQGLMGIFVPFAVYFIKNGYLTVWVGGGSNTVMGWATFTVVKSSLVGNTMAAIAGATTYNSHVFNYETGSFEFQNVHYGFTHLEVHNGLTKIFRIYDIDLIGTINRSDIPTLFNDQSIPIMSRDSELFAWYTGNIWKETGNNSWEIIIETSQPGRIQTVGANYYYSLGSVLKTQAGTVKTFDNSIIDFYIDSETIVLTTDGLFWLDSSFNIVAQAALSGVNAGSILAMAGGFLAVNLTDKIVIYSAHEFFYEIAETTNFIAITSNN